MRNNCNDYSMRVKCFEFCYWTHLRFNWNQNWADKELIASNLIIAAAKIISALKYLIKNFSSGSFLNAFSNFDWLAEYIWSNSHDACSFSLLYFVSKANWVRQLYLSQSLLKCKNCDFKLQKQQSVFRGIIQMNPTALMDVMELELYEY